jgi:ketosteroid isomerase-like protein
MRSSVLQQGSCFYFAGIDRLTFSELLSDTLMSGTKGSFSNPGRAGRQAAIARMMLIAVFAVFVATLLQAGQAKPKKNEVRHEIFELEDAWRNALLKSDTNAMSALLADDYMAITPSGMLETKQEVLSDMRAHRVHFTKLVLSERKVRFYGKTALVTSQAEVQGITPSGDISGEFRYTRVYVRDGQGRWKIVSFESNRIRHHEERKKQDEGPAGQ